MITPRRYSILLLLIAAGTLLSRLPGLEIRPMHTDEAVHAVKLGAILEGEGYHYDPVDYHGPTHYYATLPILKLCGIDNFRDMRAWQMRVVPVIFSALLILTLWLYATTLGRGATLWAAGFLAVSPAFAFYSRYYIQETLFVTFTSLFLGTLLKAWETSQRHQYRLTRLWLFGAALALGLMFATKETAILVVAAVAVTFLILPEKRTYLMLMPRSLPYLLMAVAVWAFLITDFFRNPIAIWDGVLTYVNYVLRSSGIGLHDHPWYFYLRMLMFSHYGRGPWWSEAAIVLPAMLVMLLVWRKDGPLGIRLLACYTIVLTIEYAIIPYKTPWCLLGFHFGFILLAGYGIASVIAYVRKMSTKAAISVFVILLMVHLGYQAWLANTRFCADPRNPYVYGHTAPSAQRLADRILDLEALEPGSAIYVVSKNYWPLPWSLRRLDNVGYFEHLPDLDSVPIIVLSPEFENETTAKALAGYQQEYYGLRPEVPLSLYVRHDLWAKFMAGRQ